MATIDEVVSKKVQGEIDKLIQQLEKVYSKIGEINKTGLDLYGGKTAGNTSELNSVINSYTKLSAEQSKVGKQALDLAIKEERLSQAQNRTNISNNSLEKSTISLEKARDSAAKAQERETAKLQASASLYNQTQQQINNLTKAYNELSVKKARYGGLTDNEEKRLKTLSDTLLKYNTILKGVDASIGKHTRSVGDYASAFNPLSNAINQLTREAPAFGNGVQTGFMAISNNFPAAFDAISNIIKQNKILQAQGEPTKSVLSQIASSLFSFQTLLSVGVTLLTLYGKNIVDWVSGLSFADKALREVSKSFTEIGSQSASQAKDLDKYRDVVNDTTATEQERNRALKLLKEQIPELSKVELNHANALKEVNKYTEYYIKQAAIRYRADQFIKKAGEELVKQEEIKIKVSKKEYGTGVLDYLKSLAKYGSGALTGGAANAEALKRMSDEYDSSVISQKEYEKAAELEIKHLDLRTDKTKKLTGAKKAEKDLDLEMVDVRASLFESEKLLLERQIRMYSEIANADKTNLEERLNSFANYTNKKTELEIKQFDENRRLSDLAYKKQVEDLNNTYLDYIKKESVTNSQRIKARIELSNALKSLEEKNKTDLGILEIKHSDNIVAINRETFEKINELRELYNGLEFNKKINNQELNDLLEHKNKLSNIDINTTKKQLEDIDKLKKDSDRKIKEETIQNDINVINQKLKTVEFGSIQELRLKTELYDKQKALNQLEINDLNEKKKEQEAYLKLLSDTFKGFTDDVVKGSGFSKMFDILNGGLDKFKGNAVATGLAVSDAFQEMYNFLNQGSEERFRAELERNEQQKNIAIQFAGESKTAKEEIERQYEEKRKEIQRRQAQAAKEAALFNTIINTAQAVVAALPNVPLSITVGVIGAAQAAMIADRPLPEFWTGTQNAPEGLAKTQERGREIITDSNNNIKSWGSDKGTRIDYLKKGDKVINAEKTRKIIDKGMFMNSLNGLLLENTIGTIPFRVEQKNDNSGVISEIKALRNDLASSQSSLIITRDKRGERTFEYKNGVKRELLNNSLKGIAKYVK